MHASFAAASTSNDRKGATHQVASLQQDRNRNIAIGGNRICGHTGAGATVRDADWARTEGREALPT